MPHRILLEGCELTLGQGTGIATYGRNLASALRANGYGVDVLVDTDKRLDDRDPAFNAISLYDAMRPDPWSLLQRRLGRRFGAPFGIRATKVPSNGVVADFLTTPLRGFDNVLAATDLDRLTRLHFARHGKRASVKVPETPSLFHATQAIAVTVTGCPNLYTIHDIVPLKLPSTTRDNKRYVLSMMRHLCRTADHIVTVSEFSRQEIIRFFGIDENRITNTYQAVILPSEALGWNVDQIALLIENLFGLGIEEYFLFVGAIEPKKNLSRLIDAYAASGSKYPLILTGGLGWQYDQDLEKISDERFLRYDIVENTIVPRRQVRRLPYLPPEHVVALMRGARAVLFPSLYEGFGLPVLEAMSLGTPVMTSNAASLPEVAGDAALLIDPLNIDDIARAIRALDGDRDLRTELKTRGKRRAEFFSPENYQTRVAELYQRVIG